MIKSVTGTKDILPTEISMWNYFENVVKSTMSDFNYREIRTPLFEETVLFARGIGEDTDIVSKEMYTFKDRSDTSVTLRPEMTASVVRSFIEHSLGKKQALNKLFYMAPMFRQERPQAGRLRQFYQFGAESIGSHNPSIDAELIILAYDILKHMGLQNIFVKINSLGVPESRENYKKILKDYLADKLNNLSDESKKRYDTNILRIFDSKIEEDQKIMENAPLLIEHLDDDSLEHFEKVRQTLISSKIPFEIEPGLVRGLDYYTHTAFEIVSESVGSQNALVGGGRYNLLIEQLGGDPTPGMGFAAGMERILLACTNENSLNIADDKIALYVVRLQKELVNESFNLAMYFRRNLLPTEVDYLERSVKAQMREANRYNAEYVIFIGGEEYENNQLVLKNMDNGEQENFDINNLEVIANKIKGN